ncbi:MAG: NUDIX domain-containing protein [Micrococcales bacterium]|nr:NUDIX domain-containing protein [Micrococcales bacterium]
MAHLHTAPGAGDVTASALVVRETDAGLVALVHQHKTLPWVLQVGGHVEHTENPWTALGHELAEESGYDLADLEVLQPYDPAVMQTTTSRTLPVPAAMEVHWITADHFHTDIEYVLVAHDLPTRPPADGESPDLRWCTLDELANDPAVPPSLVAVYRLAMTVLWTSWARYPATTWSVDPPDRAQVVAPEVPRPSSTAEPT